MFNIGPGELILILIIALMIFGPGKLPEIAKGLGKAVRDFKEATNGVQKQFQDAMRFDQQPVVKPPLLENRAEETTVDLNRDNSREAQAEPVVSDHEEKHS